MALSLILELSFAGPVQVQNKISAENWTARVELSVKHIQNTVPSQMGHCPIADAREEHKSSTGQREILVIPSY